MPKKAEKKKEKEHSDNHLYIILAITLVIGAIIGILITATTIKQAPSFIQTSCEIDIETLYEKPCAVTEDCYGRLELCSAQLKKCMTTVLIDKTDLRNIRIPDNEKECEANGGIWTVEYITEED